MLRNLELFFSPDRPFAFALNLLILALATIASIRALMVIVRTVPREQGVLRRIGELNPRTRDAVAATVAKSGTLVEARVDDLGALYESRQPIDAASMAAVTTATLRSQLSAAEGIGRTLIVLGLFGTLWGLGSAVTSLTATIAPTSMNVAVLSGAILSTLGGLQTAFGTTLIGLVGALVVGMFVGLGRRQQGEFLRDFERVMSTRLIPLFDTSEARNLSEAAKALASIEQRVAQDMLQIITKIGSEGAALREQLQGDFDRLEDAFERRAQHLVDATGKALSSTLAIIGERGEGEPTLAEYVRAVRSTVDDLERSVRSVRALIPELEERLLSAIERQRSGLEDVFTRHQSAMEPLLEGQAESVAKLTKVADQNIDTSAGLIEALNHFTRELQDARARWVKLDEKIIDIGRSTQQGIENGLRGVTEELRRDQSAGADERERTARHLATFETELRRHLQQLRDERSQVLGQMNEIVGVIRTAVETAVLQVGERLAAREDSTASELQRAIETLAREFRGLVRVAPPARFATDGIGAPTAQLDRIRAPSTIRPESGE